MFIATLGTLELFDGTPDAPGPRVLGAGKPLAMLTYLALVRGRRATRGQLIDLLWAGNDPERARATLRQTIWSLRQRVGEDAITVEEDSVGLTRELATDSSHFEALVANGDYERAWQAYARPFIPDFAVPGGAAFEQWADLQRNRLRTVWISVGTELVRRMLADGRTADAVLIASRLVEDSPEREALWRMLIEARLSDGDRVGATADVEGLLAQLQLIEKRPSADTRALIDRVRSPLRAHGTDDIGGDISSPTKGPLDAVDARLRTELVGREQAFATLLTAWRAASSGVGTLCAVRGFAGLGKSRLLNEFKQRLDAMTVATITVRAHQADRDMPYALVASLVAALAERPGAAAVSASTAAVLVSLVPSLSNSYPRAAAASTDTEELPRLRALALTELLQVVCDEAPLAVLVDDLHWADDASQQLLASVSERVTEMPFLLATTFRPVRGAWAPPRRAIVIDLVPLSSEHVGALLLSIADVSDDLRLHLAHLLHEVSGGIPLLVISTIDLAIERRWLQIVQGRWVCPSTEQLRQELARGSVLEQLMIDLPPDALSMLVAIALMRRPLDAAMLTAAIGDHGTASPPSAVTVSLEQRGLLVQDGEAWDVAHDRLADAALSMASLAQRREIAQRLARELQRPASPTLRSLQQAGRLLVSVNDPEGMRTFRRWMTLSRDRGYWRNPITAADLFLGEEATVATAQRLTASIPLGTRFVHGYPMVAAALGFMLLSVGGTAASRAMSRFLAPPAVSMELIEPPTSQGFLFVPDTSAPLRVAFRDAHGNITNNTPRSARVRMVPSVGTPTLLGTLQQPVSGGVAEFSDLRLHPDGVMQFEVSAGDLPPVRSRKIYVEASGAERLQIASATLNGQPIDSTHPVITVRPGAAIDGRMRLHSITSKRDAAMLAGAVAMWGDRRTNFIVLCSLPPHGERITPLLHFSNANTGGLLHAPTTPGRYSLALVMGAETEMRFIASQSNWANGTPRWFDNNDIADLSPAAIDQLSREGMIENTLFSQNSFTVPQGQYTKNRVTGTVITIIVE